MSTRLQRIFAMLGVLGIAGCAVLSGGNLHEEKALIKSAGLNPSVFRSGYVLDGSKRIHFVRGGRSGSEVVVLLPGWPQTWYAWRKIMPQLAERFDVVAIDPPGTGGSAIPDQAYDTDTVASHIHLALRELDVREPFHLVAHDIGTWIGYSYANRYPEDVERLVLMDAAVPGLNLEQAFTIENAPRLFQFFFNAVEELPELLTAGREREFLAFLFRTKALVPGAITEADLDHYTSAYKAPGRMKAGFDYYRAVPESARKNRGATLSMPVLALGSEAGVKDSLVRALRGGPAPQAVGGTLAGSGHYMLEEKPSELLEQVESFLAEDTVKAPRGLIAVDKMAGVVHFLDPQSFEVLKTLSDLAPRPHELLVVEERGEAFVPSYGTGIYGANPEPGHIINVIDLDTQRVAAKIDTLPYKSPHTMRMGKDGFLYATSENSAAVLVIDVEARAVVATIDTGSQGSHRLVVIPHSSKIYTSNELDKPWGSVLDMRTRALVGRIALTSGSGGVAASPDGKFAAFVDATEPLVHLVDTTTDLVVRVLELDAHSKPAQIARWSPDGKHLVVTSLEGSSATILSGEMLSSQVRVDTGSQPMDMAFHPDGQRVIIGNQGDGTLSVIDLASGLELARPEVGIGVEALAFY